MPEAWFDSTRERVEQLELLAKEPAQRALVTSFLEMAAQNDGLVYQLQILEKLFEETFTYSTDIENAQYYSKEIALRVTGLVRENISLDD